VRVDPSFFDDVDKLQFATVGTQEETDRQVLARRDDVQELMRKHKIHVQSWSERFFSENFVACVIGARQQKLWSDAKKNFTEPLGDDDDLWDEQRRLAAVPGGLRARALELQIPTTLLAKTLLGGREFGELCTDGGCDQDDVRNEYGDEFISIAKQCLKERERDYQTSTLLITSTDSVRGVDPNKLKEGGTASVSRGARLEARLAVYLGKKNITFRTEQELETGTGVRRPDILFDEPRTLFGIVGVTWIEAKSAFLWPGHTGQKELDYVLEHITELYTQRGPGLVLWGCAGWHTEMEALVRARGVPADRVKFIRFTRMEKPKQRAETLAEAHGTPPPSEDEVDDS
jgi:hypothetical protein